MKIKYFDINRFNLNFLDSFQKSLERFVTSDYMVLGEPMNSFEKKYSTFNDVDYCSGVSNGLSALILCLKSLNIGPGDEVMVPSNTYIATWLSITHVGAKIIPIEPFEKSMNLNFNLIESHITKKTKAVIAVNLYGQAAQLDQISEICSKNNLYLIEDNAQSQGAFCAGKKTGSWGIVNATSFYPGKNIGALGEAGATTTNDKDIDRRIKQLRNYGSKSKYINEEIGFNFRMDNLQAKFIELKIDEYKNVVNRKSEIAEMYKKNLTGISFQHLPDNCTSVFHIFPVITDKRDELQKFLYNSGIETMIHYPIPPHKQKAYASLYFKDELFPIANKIAESELSLPIDPFMTNEEVYYIIEKINKFYYGL